jgi:primary-amine oxidase
MGRDLGGDMPQLNRSRMLSFLKLILSFFYIAILNSGCTRCCPTISQQPASSPPNEVIQEFPTGGPMETAWRVRWAEAPAKGLSITGAWFKRGPSEPWMRILWDARLADIFVPYHSGWPRYYDLTGFNFGLVQATPQDAGCCGRLLGTPPRVIKEVRDRGVAWKDDTAVHRGQELVLWGTLDAANYNYLMQYGFQDDGTITFRLGATARNLPGRETEAHMHNGLWRVDMDLNGFPNDSALLTRHQEPAGGDMAVDTISPLNDGVEGFADWTAEEFTQIRVLDTLAKNTQGNNISYDLIPLRQGTARHNEDFSKHDFWVSRYKGTELFYNEVPDYVSNHETITNTDVVLWHISPVHHLPRNEDGQHQGGLWKGVALLMWGGFDLRPRNLFGETPLHP